MQKPYVLRSKKPASYFYLELEITVSFHQGWEKETEYGELLAQNFERDKAIGYTVSGPQKADFRFKANWTPRGSMCSLVVN